MSCPASPEDRATTRAFQPRFGVSYALDDAQRTTLFGGIGMAVSGEPRLEQAAATALFTLAAHQAPNGQIPKFVDVARAVQDVLDRQINPGVGSHGGMVSLVDVRDGATHARLSMWHTRPVPLPDDPDDLFNGTSVGRWDSDTLLVETVGQVGSRAYLSLAFRSARIYQRPDGSRGWHWARFSRERDQVDASRAAVPTFPTASSPISVRRSIISRASRCCSSR